MRADRTDRDVLIALLGHAGAVISGSSFHCPWHDDRSASGSIHCGSHRHWRWRCHACGLHGDAWDVADLLSGASLVDWLASVGAGSRNRCHRPIMAATAVTGENHGAWPRRRWATLEALMQSKCQQAQARVEAWYSYRVPGQRMPDLVVVRLRTADGRKTFRQAHHDGNGWVDAASRKPWPLYRLPDFIAHKLVFLVEGEKSAEALWDVGLPASTTPGGAGKAAACDLSPLQHRTVILWPDHDVRGHKHMEDVAQRLSRLGAPPRQQSIDPARLGMGDKEDVVDFLCRFPGDGEAKRLAVVRLAAQLLDSHHGVDV